MQSTSRVVSTIVDDHLSLLHDDDEGKKKMNDEGEESPAREESTTISDESVPHDDYMVVMEPLQFGMTHTHTHTQHTTHTHCFFLNF